MELDREEIELVLKHRLSKINLLIDSEKSMTKLTAIGNQVDFVIINIVDKFAKKAESITLSNDDCKKLYDFLTKRHSILSRLKNKKQV